MSQPQSKFQVISKKNRIKIGVAIVIVANSAIIYGFWQLKAGKPRFNLEVAVDLYTDKGADGLAFYEATANEKCIDVLNEQATKPATTYTTAVAPAKGEKSEAKKVTEVPLVHATAPGCSKPLTLPAGAEKLGEKGFVGLQINIDKNGRVERGEVDRSSGFPELDEAALKQVTESLHFEPCKKGDTAVACKQYIKYRWKTPSL